MAFEQLESVWPVSGNILIRKGAAYFVSGRSNFLDGGLRFHKLDAKTGKVLVQTTVNETDPETGKNLADRHQILNMPRRTHRHPLVRRGLRLHAFSKV